MLVIKDDEHDRLWLKQVSSDVHEAQKKLYVYQVCIPSCFH